MSNLTGGAGPHYTNPVAYYWLSGQTERWPDGHPQTTTPENKRLRLQFAPNPPHETYNHGNTFIGDVFDGISTDNLDAEGAPAVEAFRIVFTPPAGRYNLLLQVGTSYRARVLNHLLFKLKDSGADDYLAFVHSGQLAAALAEPGNNAVGSLTLSVPDLVVAEGDRFYWMQFGAGADQAIKAFMRLEKVA